MGGVTINMPISTEGSGMSFHETKDRLGSRGRKWLSGGGGGGQKVVIRGWVGRVNC